MSKKTFVAFGLVVILLAVLIPWLVFRADGEEASGADVPSSLHSGKMLFQTNCGTCHSLYSAGTDGNFGPDLDELLEESTVEANEERVKNAIEEGVDSSTTAGRMPPGILSGAQAEEVAEFVAKTVGQG
jgi:mono/diheme cytochrome c family protein